jgi:hypothetical protein
VATKFLNKLQLVALASDPASADEGDLYFNTADNTVRVYEGDAWRTVVESGFHQYLDLDLTHSVADVEGRLVWGVEDGTLHVGMTDGIVQQVGMELFMPPTKNNSGATINRGEFVMATGTLGDRITIAKAVSDGTVLSDYMIGIAANNIPNGSETGLITTQGEVRQIDTSAWAVGTILYPNPDTPGGLTATKPEAPAIRTAIAFVLRQHATTGRIMVRMDIGSELGGTDSNVKFTTLTNGDIISYDSSDGLWKNAQPTAVSSEGFVGQLLLGGM